MAGGIRRWYAWGVVSLVVVCLIVAAMIFTGTRRDDPSFSQHPGFDAYFAAHPPRTTLPSPVEQELLRRHRPHFFLPGGHAGLIDFYEDYIAQGTLYDARGGVISQSVDQALLNAHKADPAITFEHRQAPDAGQSPTVLARIDYDDVELGEEAGRFTFLTYHAVFRHSGLAAGLVFWQTWAAAFAGNLDDWHQLDHYTAATLVLDESSAPVALMLQQHNYQRTYLLGEAYELPADGRPEIDVAIRSNELYPHAGSRREHRSVRFLDPVSFKYMLNAGRRPLLAAADITDPAEEQDYALAFVSPDDAFYTFKGRLGARRSLPGRDSPPGADYNTLPWMKPLHRQFLLGYWRPGRRGDAERLNLALERDDWRAAFMQAQSAVLETNLLCARRWDSNCAFE